MDDEEWDRLMRDIQPQMFGGSAADEAGNVTGDQSKSSDNPNMDPNTSEQTEEEEKPPSVSAASASTNLPTSTLITPLKRRHSSQGSNESRSSSIESTAEVDQLQKRRRYAEHMVHIYRKKESNYQKIIALQRNRQQELFQKFTNNVIKPTEMLNRVLVQWRLKVKNITDSYLNRFNKSKRERNRLEESIDYRFMITSFVSNVGNLPVTEEQLKLLRDSDECLIPIRIEVEVENMRFRDTFTWNAFEQILTPETFAGIICDDFRLNKSLFLEMISQQITTQVEDFWRYAPIAMDRVEVYSQLLMLDSEKVDSYFSNYLSGKGKFDLSKLSKSGDLAHFETELLQRLDNLCQNHSHVVEHITSKILPFEFPGELRVPIKICVIVNNLQLTDTFELDLLSTPFRSNIPEVIATSICSDLGLGGEFITATAHMIREQMWLYLKSLKILGYPFDGSPILDEEFGQHFLSVLAESSDSDIKSQEYDFGVALRSPEDRENWIPEYFTLSDGEMERLEKDRERESRRKRRGARGRRAAVKVDEVDMFGFGIPKTSAPGDVFSKSQSLLLDRSAIVLPDLKEPLKTQRNQIDRSTQIRDEVQNNPVSTKETRKSTRSGRAAAQAALENISAISKEESKQEVPATIGRFAMPINSASPSLVPRPAGLPQIPVNLGNIPQFSGITARPELLQSQYLRQLQYQQILLAQQYRINQQLQNSSVSPPHTATPPRGRPPASTPPGGPQNFRLE